MVILYNGCNPICIVNNKNNCSTLKDVENSNGNLLIIDIKVDVWLGIGSNDYNGIGDKSKHVIHCIESLSNDIFIDEDWESSW